MTTRSFSRQFLGLALGAVLLAGCGGSSGSDTTTATPAATESAAASSPDTAVAAPASDAGGTAAGAGTATPSGDGPAGVDISQSPLCKLVSTETLTTLFGDLKIDPPGVSQNSCSLFAKPEGAAFGSSLELLPMLVPLESTVSTSKEMGLTVEDLPGIGDKAVFISGKVEGFAPKTQVIFKKGETTYTVAVTFTTGVPEVDPATVKGLIVPIAEQYAAQT